ncbi:MAG: Asp-tRNA(Asn)/Glu-tRNA(Gln) amidotransferase subunit GatA [Acidimicrobiia bacterium]
MSKIVGENSDSLMQSFNSGEVTAQEIAQAALDAAQSQEPDLDAYIEIMHVQAIEQAQDIDRRKAAGEKLGPLAGTTVSVKDNMATYGVKTTCASKILENWIPVYDATVISKLKQADAIIIGKTNLDEFAMGSSTENSAFKTTKNPHDVTKVPGGSSGGSAATVAAGAVTFALGSDTGGSIRQPASLCGIVGVKPTYGRVSRYGLVAFGSSLDQIGPFARNVKDAAKLLDVLSGHDVRDSTSINKTYSPLVDVLNKGVQGLRVGIIEELRGPTGFQSEVLSAIDDTAAMLEKQGASVGTVSVPASANGLSAYYIIAPAEASSNLARFDGMRYGLRVERQTAGETNEASRQAGFGMEVKRRIMLGTYALSAGYYDAYYAQAQKVRTIMIKDFEKAYEDYDVLLAPTSPTTAFGIGEKTQDPYEMYLTDVCTLPTNIVGATSMSVPIGVDQNGLPIGAQIFAPPLGEDVMFQVASVVESEMGYNKVPEIFVG